MAAATRLDVSTLDTVVIPSEGLKQSFKFRRTKASDKIEIGLQQATYLRGIGNTVVNMDASNMAYVFAALNVVLLDPPNYAWDDVVDEDDIYELYKKYDDWNSSFRAAKQARMGKPS